MAGSYLEERINDCVHDLMGSKISAEYEHLFKKAVPRNCCTRYHKWRDYTPNSIAPAPAYNFPLAPEEMQYESDIFKMVHKEENVVRDLSDDPVVNMILSKKKELAKTVDIHRLFAKSWKKPDTRFAMILPPKELGNTTGLDFFLETDEDLKWLIYYLVEALVEAKDITGDDAHFVMWMFSSTVEINPFTQIVLEDKDYKFEPPSDYLDYWSTQFEKYFCLVEQNALKFKDLSKYSSSLKPYKSPGISNRNVDGSIFERKKNYVVPTADCLSGLESEGGHINEEVVLHNGWLKASTYGLKVSKMEEILPKLKRRLRLADEGLIWKMDPETIFRLIQEDNANVSLLSTRINNPDTHLRKGKDIDSVRDWLDGHMKQVVGGKTFLFSLEDAGKPREAMFVLDRKVYKAKVDPLIYSSLTFEKLKNILTGAKECLVKVGGRIVGWPAKVGFGIAKRIRGIMPAPFQQTMSRNPYQKLWASNLEEGPCGFASCSDKNEWFQTTLDLMKTQRKGATWRAMDLSHFETFGSTNRDWVLKLFGTSERRQRFMQDCGWTVLAAMFEPISSPYLVASGSSVTSPTSLQTGGFMNAMITSEYARDPLAHFKEYVDTILYFACENFIQKAREQGLELENPFPAKKPFLEFEDKKGNQIIQKIGAGSDDQSDYWVSNVYTDEALLNFLKDNKMAQQLEERGLLTQEFGEFTSFGVKRERDSLGQDVTSLLSKLFLIEHETNPEAILFSFYLIISSIPGLEDAFRKALFRLKRERGVDIGDYLLFCRLAAIHYIHVVQGSADWMSTLYDVESPKGKVISETLEAAGLDPTGSLKVPEELTRRCLEVIIKFCQGSSMETIDLVDEPPLSELYPKFNLREYLNKSEIPTVAGGNDESNRQSN